MRRVPDGERLELEQAVQQVSHVILLARCVVPAKSYMSLLREAVPEIVN